jgi:hypothetical protein
MRLIALGTSTLVIGWMLAGCGDYGDDDDSDTGGGTAVGGGTGVGGDATGAGGTTPRLEVQGLTCVPT